MSDYSSMPTLMAAIEYLPKKQQKINKIMEKERKITAPDGCEIEKVEIVDGAAVITFKQKERKLPKSWEDFCKMFPIKKGKEHYFNTSSQILNCVDNSCIRDDHKDKNMLPDRTTAEAVLALCQLIQLRNCYNGNWVPDWKDEERKYMINFYEGGICNGDVSSTSDILHFRNKELRN